MAQKVAITGAFSYSGRYLAKLLLDQGHHVVNLSSRQAPIASAPLSASDVRRSVLWCTYWIRFQRDGDTFAAAAQRCQKLFQLAKEAGVRRIVYTSHTHATVGSPFPYISGKARAVAALRESGVSYAVARPCGIFGDSPRESILMNNAAWVLRRSPLFLLAGDGMQRFQPIHVRDMAQLLLDLGRLGDARPCNEERDACGPDDPTALELFRHLATSVGAWSRVSAPGVLSTRLVTRMTQPINWITGDILLDGDDLDLLCSGLTVAEVPSDPDIASRRSLMTWIREAGDRLGEEYVSSMKRYYYAR